MQNIIIATISYAFFQVMSGFGARRLSDMWFFISGTISILFLTLLITFYYKSKGVGIGSFNVPGFLFVFLANIGIAIFTIYLGKSFQTYPSTFVIPLLFGSAIAISTIASFIIDARLPTFLELVSLLLVSGGLVLFSFVGKR